MRDIFKGSLIIFIFKVFGAGALFLTYVLIPRYYGVEAFGVFNIMFALIMVLTVISRMGLDIYVIRIIPPLENNYHKISLFLKRVLQIITILSILVGGIMFSFITPIDQYLFKSIDATSYLIVLALMVLPYTLFNVLVEVFRGFNDIKIYSFFRNLSQNGIVVILLGISIVFSLSYHPVEILFLGIAIISIILLFILYFFLKKRNVSIFIPGKYNDGIIKYSYPMFLTSSVMFLMGYVDSFMIAYYLDEYQVGIYAACISLSMILTFIPMAIGVYISPKVATSYHRGEHLKVKNLFNDSLKLIAVTTLPIFGLIVFFADFFLGLFGSAFIVASTTLFIVNLGFLSEALCGPVGFVLNMTNNQHIFMKILIISLLINITLNALLIPFYGINGAAVALLCSMLFWTISGFIILKAKDII